MPVTVICPHCKTMTNVTTPEMDVAHVALNVLGGVVAALDNRVGVADAQQYAVELSFRLAQAYVDEVQRRLRERRVQHGAT